MNSFSIPIANKIFHVTVFFLFTIVINLWHQKFVTADVIAVSVNEQHVIQRQKQDFDKSLNLKMYTAKRLTDEFPEKSWTKHGVNKVLKNWRNTDTVDIATTRNHTTTGSFQSHPHFTKENNYAFECLIFLIYR